MACNTKAGPALAITFIEEHLTGVKLTQKDWHVLREAASGGERLSNAAANDASKVHCARALANSLRVPKDEADQFVTGFMSTKNTVGTCDTLKYIAENGMPAEILTRPRRNRGRAVAKQKRILNVGESGQAVVVKDTVPSGIVVNGMNQRMPLYRVIAHGETVAVSLSQSHAERIADKVNSSQKRS